MKKIFSSLVLVALLVMAGCSLFVNPIVGTWSGTFLGSSITYTFEQDGTYTVKNSSGDTTTGTYTASDGALVLTADGGTSTTCAYTINGSTLTITNVISLVLTKQ